MAKGAAKETQLGTLHARITDVFIKVIARYEERLNKMDSLTADEAENEFWQELFNDAALPSPAMLSAVTKFLKDNEISFETERLAELSDQERRLQERRAQRGNVVSLTDLPIQGAADG